MSDHPISGSVDSDQIAQAARVAVDALIRDGVELRVVENVLQVWASKTYGIGFFYGGGAGWCVVNLNGLRLDDTNGDPLFFRSLHELVAWLLDAERASAARPAKKDGAT